MGGKFMPSSMIHPRNTYIFEAISFPASDVSLSNLASLVILKSLFPVVKMDIR